MVKGTNKVEFTARLKEACLNAGHAGRGLGKKITNALAEQKIKVSGPAVWKWLNSESIPDSSNILALSKWLGVRPEWLEYGRGSKTIDGISISKVEREEVEPWDSSSPINDDEVVIPFFKSIELAAGVGCCTNEDYDGLKLRFSRSTLRRYGACPSNVVAFTVHGDSMSPVIPNGSTVTVDCGHQNIVDGGIYAIEQGDLFRIKLLYRQPGKLIVRSFNSVEFPDEVTESQDVKIIGRVINWSVMAW
ncbi:helix-turn-helix transcriptional regulator [Xenorhabdus bovienii]|uniref:LexA family transcriptional regulator n=1 Tax=Xenorhabdus bovienii TaxID=40576 RepID=UPI00237CAF7C|nr:helix-turn-helix transcriptional regulator [Xenorhabdus bovienii]MDE1484707.1 helix-turn-helix transcriptional regulator [Xenorhabdus bovienii]MDE9443794.1 helix-turn-helix transcriptional regulator [Xenorhabdus bovienii]MDE9467490.1 helix-turn-helix transcriptional regulator [Xenorhabdus bovienii]MDE9495682.1 helix-turn-helix transcriptional regulator [Xenorhabdus bovienii]MDE9504078.1 helix-turn-helix transcriptional regulator [Xenorhabdus bovienii]